MKFCTECGVELEAIPDKSILGPRPTKCRDCRIEELEFKVRRLLENL